MQVRGRKSIREVLEGLKAQEKKPNPFVSERSALQPEQPKINRPIQPGQPVLNKPTYGPQQPKVNKEPPLSFVQLQQKLDKLMRNIEETEKRMKTSSNYLNYYYDLQKMEKEFLQLCGQIDKYDTDFNEFSPIFVRKLKIRRETIQKKPKK